MRLLLLPGTLCDAAVWAPLVAGVSDLAECVVGDVGGQDSVTAVAETLLATHSGRFAVAGFSFGGFVAFQMALIAPDRVTALGLIATTARPLPVEQHADRRRRLAFGEAAGVEAYVAALLPAYLHPDHVTDPTVTAAIRDMAARQGIDVLRRQVAANMARPDVRPDFPRLLPPTMVVCGDSDAVCKPEDHREMAAGIAGAALTIVAQAGHFVLLEQPGAVIAATREWLSRQT